MRVVLIVRTWVIVAVGLFAPVAAWAETVRIPAGPFLLGGGEDGPPQRVWVADYAIDLYEITNQEYAAAFSAHVYPAGAERHAVTDLTWFEAQAYCERAGGRLPTAAEWEKAARGVDGRVYPWGDRPLRISPQPSFSGVVKRPVGYLRADISPYGVHDMAGSVWEWTAEALDAERAARGGAWNLHLDFEFSAAYDRIRLAPEARFPFLGFRCVRPS